MTSRRVIVAVFALLFSNPPMLSHAQDCQYQSTSFGREFEMSTARVIRFLDQLPKDVELEFKPNGQSQQFGQFHYGSENGTRVALMLDKLSNDEFDLYVDSNRDRKLNPNERVEGDGRNRTLDLSAQIVVDGKTEAVRRVVTFSQSTTSPSFSIKTEGGCQGQFELAGQTIRSIRIDGNANGLFADSNDQIWLDLNRDGKWNPVTERFAFQTAMRLNDKRYSVRGDSLGEHFRLSEIEGEGKVDFDIQLSNRNATIESAQLILYGDDGSSFAFNSAEQVTLPVGKYVVVSLEVSLLDGDDSTPWYFSFCQSGQSSDQVWHDVAQDSTTSISIFKTLNFDLYGSDEYEPDKTLSMRPYLTTNDGLYLVASGRGEPDQDGDVTGNTANVVARDIAGNLFSACESGFR